MLESIFYYERLPAPPKYVSHWTPLVREKMQVMRRLIEEGRDPRTVTYYGGYGKLFDFSDRDLLLYAAYWQIPVTLNMEQFRASAKSSRQPSREKEAS